MILSSIMLSEINKSTFFVFKYVEEPKSDIKQNRNIIIACVSPTDRNSFQFIEGCSPLATVDANKVMATVNRGNYYIIKRATIVHNHSILFFAFLEY